MTECRKEPAEKRLLIFANNCISKTNSNGRTIANLLADYPRDLVAQFYIHGPTPDFDRCGSFFRVSDGDALNAFLKRKKVGAYVSCEDENIPQQTSGNGRKRNAATMLLRDLAWSLGNWKRGGFWKFVEDFQPEVLLLQAGDSPFMFKLSVKVSKRYKIPLVIYSSEDYPFKNHDYFRAKGFAHALYPVFRSRLCYCFGKAMKHAAYAIYNSEYLQQTHNEKYKLPSTVIYTATQIEPAKQPAEKFSAVYLGNMALNRHLQLIEIAQTLHDISKEAYLDVYGKAPSKEVEDAFAQCEAVRFNGFVSYEEVIEILQKSALLVHAESFDDFYRKDLKHAMSTKIADSLGSGNCFLLYAPEEMACTRYLQDKKVAYVVSHREQLREVLEKLILQPESRRTYLSAAQKLVKENHNSDLCAKKFRSVISEAERK